jgi:A/G-specific adenine glycosylase
MSGPAKRQSTAKGAKLEAMRRALLAWYARNMRQLPWRRDRDPYRVWVSEIMLQQTRVAAVLEHYHAFLEAFPTLQHLAASPEEQVLARWSGLGYYRRARMLQQAARKVVHEADGIVPQASHELRKLPGVGRYTAAAVASIAFGEPIAVVDGNVERVLSRLHGKAVTASAAWRDAQELLDRGHPGEWNQAMMELGATVCTPRQPQCPVCPLAGWCSSHIGQPQREKGAVNAPSAWAGRSPAKRQKVQSLRNLIARGDRIFLVQRPADTAKMAGMWELPECAAPQQAKDGLVAGPADDSKPQRGELCVVRHSITDTDYTVRVVQLGLRALGAEQERAGRWVSREEAFELPLTGLTRKILRRVP